ncbi:MAG: tyrosine-type recombinase/integrase [Bdellovibrionales bacterium]
MPLSDIKIRNAKPKEKPYKLTDGGGLFLLVKPIGSKLWRLKYRYMGKEKLFSIGAYPLVGAGEARTIRDNVKKLLANGIDPTQHRRTTKQQKMEANQNTFEAVARRWLSIKKTEKTHQVRSLRRLELHAFPRLGFRPIGEIKTVELATCLEAIEREGILETAHRVKQLIQQVFRYAVRRGVIEHNPAGDLRDIIGHAEKQNRACIAPAELPELLQKMKDYNGDPLTLAAMNLLALTFVRTGELIGARWEEIDWQREEWRIPASRMKMRNEHIVPLSRQAKAIFKKLHEQTGRYDLVFFSPANKSKHISNNAVLSALKRMGYAGRMTGHGFRALASTVLNEQRKYHPDVIERQLAHADRNEVRAAYNRAEHLLERKKMMQDWADYLDRQGVQGKVVSGKFRKGA